MEREVLLGAIKKIPLKINTCSICGYECCFYFNGEMFGYDSGCGCTYGRGGWRPRPETELDFYLQQPSWQPTLEKFVAEANGLN
jgi:hypothetical protein